MNTKWSVDCPACGGQLDDELTIEVQDPWFGTPGRFGYASCLLHACQSLVLVPPPPSALLDIAYSNYYTHGSSITRLQLLTRSLVPRKRRLGALHLPRPRCGDELIDIGCGDGTDLVSLRGQGWKVAGIEPDPAAREVARTRGLTVYDSLQAVPRSASFAVAIMRHVVEHVRDPLSELASIRNILTGDGRLVLVTPNRHAYGAAVFGPYWRGFDSPRHLQIFSPDALRSLAEIAGFEDVNVRTGASSMGGLEAETLMLFGRRLGLPAAMAYATGRSLGLALGAIFGALNRATGRRHGEEIFLVALPNRPAVTRSSQDRP